ncbi:MAG TPA: hypothetical protein VK357_16140 [Rubrobacteraceae bacterium]|nr:hypothetical protein [Rubrobacteraceae bacterium]
MPEIVQAHGAGEPGALEDRLEASSSEVPCVHSLTDLVGEDEPVILYEPREPHPLL